MYFAYRFAFETTDSNARTIIVHFLTENQAFNGADHALSHATRRQWALSLTPQANWTVLPCHPYIEELKSADLQYSSYCTHAHDTVLNIFIK